MNAQQVTLAGPAALATSRFPEVVVSGTVLIQDGTLLPPALILDTEPYCSGWSSIAGIDLSEFDRRIRRAGWNLFHLAPPMKTTVFGFRGARMMRRALGTLISTVEASRYNCMRVESVDTGSILRIPYIRMSCRPCHIQQSPLLTRRASKTFSKAVRTCSYV